MALKWRHMTSKGVWSFAANPLAATRFLRTPWIKVTSKDPVLIFFLKLPHKELRFDYHIGYVIEIVFLLLWIMNSNLASEINENVLKNVLNIMTFLLKSVPFLLRMEILFKKSAWFPTRFDFDIQCEAVWATQNITIWINCPFEHKVTEFFIADWRVWTRPGRVGPTMWNVALALRKRFRK